MASLLKNYKSKNKIAILFITLLIGFSVSSCKSISKKINGEIKPETENLESIKKFIAETQLAINPEKQLYLLNDSTKIFLLSMKQNNPGETVSIPNCYLFDKDFKLLDDGKLGGCVTDRPSIEGKDFYEELIRANKNTPSNHSLNDWKGLFVNYKHQDYFPFEKNGRAKAVIAWAKFKGKKWADEVNHMIGQLQQSTAPIDIYILNMDKY